MDTVAQLQLSGQSTLDMTCPPVQSKPGAFTSTKVPKFSGVISWALQLLSHLEGDALNIALLVPKAKRATRAGLIRALMQHYGSPGRLADYRCQFEKTARHEVEDPSIFAISLETLAVKAFGDMGLNAQLRLIGELCSAATSR